MTEADMRPNPISHVPLHTEEHAWTQYCIKIQCDPLPRKATEGPWGYCRACAFEVAVNDSGNLVRHYRGRHALSGWGAIDSLLPCSGSGRKPGVQPSPDIPLQGHPEIPDAEPDVEE